MQEDLDFLKKLPKDKNDVYIEYDRFTFDNFFRLLLKADFGYEDALMFMLANCSLSALIFQERLHNKKYRKLSPDDVLSADLAVYRAKVIYDLMQIDQGRN